VKKPVKEIKSAWGIGDAPVQEHASTASSMGLEHLQPVAVSHIPDSSLPHMGNDTATLPEDNAKKWACPVCTLLNPEMHLICDACGSLRPAKVEEKVEPVHHEPEPDEGPFVLPSKTVKSRTAARVHGKARSAEAALHPLPQRNARPRPPPRTCVAGYNPANAASGPKWAERQVDTLYWQKAEEDADPELACYVWNRHLDRPQVDRRNHETNIKWNLVH